MRVAPTFETFRRHPDAEPCIYEIKEPPWSTLDPGIVELVRLLWLAGFNPTDSGDGESKPADERTIDGRRWLSWFRHGRPLPRHRMPKPYVMLHLGAAFEALP